METRAGDFVLDKPRSALLRRAGTALSQMAGRQQGHLFPWAPVCLGVGVGTYFAAPVEPPAELFAVAGLALGAVWLLAWRFGQHRVSWVSVLLWALTLAVLGGALASGRAHRVAEPVLNFRYYGAVEGRVVAVDRSASEKSRLTLDQVRLNRVSPGRTPLRVRISLHGPDVIGDINPGDRIMTTGHLGPPSGPVEPGGFDFQRHLWFQQLGALGYTRNPVLRAATADQANGGFSLWLYASRLSLAQAIKSRMSETEGPFAAAIITGDRADLDASALEVLRASNLAHLLAISGLHMGLLTGAVFALVRLVISFIPPIALRVNARKIAAVAAFVAAFVYLGVSGASVATQRAFIMVCVMLLAICLERPALSLRAVAMAALVVLALTPEALIGPGFQMSFAATIALVAVFTLIRDRALFLRLPRWLNGTASLVISSFIAGAATAPIGAAHFNQIAQYGLLANLLSVPVMGLVVMPGALFAALLTPFGLENAGLVIMQLGLGWILEVAEFVAGLGGSTRAVVAPGPWVLPLVAMGGLILCLWQGPGRLFALAPLVAAGVMWQATERPLVLISETGRLLGVQAANGRALNKPKGDGFSAQVWLENDGDPATQEQAAERLGLDANQVTLDLDGTTLLFDARNPDDLDLNMLCSVGDIVVVPRVDTPLPTGCFGWTELAFLSGGSVAIHRAPGGLRFEDSRTLQGDRLWVIKTSSRSSR